MEHPLMVGVWVMVMDETVEAVEAQMDVVDPEVLMVEVEVDVGQRRGWAGTLPGRAVYFYLQVLGIYSRLCCCDPYPLAWWVMVIVRKQVLTPSCHTRVAGSETSVQPPSALAIVRLSTRVLDRLKLSTGRV